MLIVLGFSFSIGYTQETKRTEFILEIDPLPYLLGGVGGHIGWSPKNTGKITMGLGFVAKPEFPDAFINQNSKNKDQGWQLKVNQGMGIWGQYYLKEQNQGWFTGIQLFTQEIQLTNTNYPGETDRTNTLLIAVQGGYVWYPFSKHNFYLRPWGGLGYQTTISPTFEPDKVDPDLQIGNKKYYLAGIMPFATLHLGYRIKYGYF